MPEPIEEMARTILCDPIRIKIGDIANGACESIKQKLVFTGTEIGKLNAIHNMITEGIPTPMLIFVQSKSR
jgi:ATP-dependent RNA helicase DDX52/ROK1